MIVPGTPIILTSEHESYFFISVLLHTSHIEIVNCEEVYFNKIGALKSVSKVSLQYSVLSRIPAPAFPSASVMVQGIPRPVKTDDQVENNAEIDIPIRF